MFDDIPLFLHSKINSKIKVLGIDEMTEYYLSEEIILLIFTFLTNTNKYKYKINDNKWACFPPSESSVG
jgi:hypothetical protein